MASIFATACHGFGGRPGSTVTARGWPIDKAENIHGVIALCMAVQVAQARPEPVKLLGWI